MGRTREFDESVVLAKAMHAFRRKGYAGSSVRDLEQATGLSGGSLYHAYGGKRGLFDAAFEHYNSAVLQARLDRYAPPGSGVEGLQKLFRSLLHEPDGERSGCLITNTAVEFGPHATHPCVGRAFDLLERTFDERLAESAATTDDKRSASTTRLLTLYQGVLVLVRAGYDLDSVERMITNEFHQLTKG